MNPIRVLSLGAGVQSSTVLLMSCRGILPKLDAAIFADTQWEPRAVYDNLDWLEQEAAKCGIPVHRVTNGNLREHVMEGFVRGKKKEGKRYATIPLRVLNPDGSQGMIRRQCTSEYKIVPIERFMRRQLLGLKKGEVAPLRCVEQWFGISADEMRRVRMSRDHWKTNVYPLAALPNSLLDRPYTRMMCERWLEEHYPGRVFPRSACIGCPYHSDNEWRQIRSNPEEWADAIEVDEKVRHADGMNGKVFLHRSCQPLAEVDLRTDVDMGQQTFGFGEECLGYCGN